MKKIILSIGIFIILFLSLKAQNFTFGENYTCIKCKLIYCKIGKKDVAHVGINHVIYQTYYNIQRSMKINLYDYSFCNNLIFDNDRELITYTTKYNEKGYNDTINNQLLFKDEQLYSRIMYYVGKDSRNYFDNLIKNVNKKLKKYNENDLTGYYYIKDMCIYLYMYSKKDNLVSLMIEPIENLDSSEIENKIVKK